MTLLYGALIAAAVFLAIVGTLTRLGVADKKAETWTEDDQGAYEVLCSWEREK